MSLTPDYTHKVYAGVLGKAIGVYLGRPIEGWPYKRLIEVFGDIAYYVNQHPHFAKKPPLIVTDDDITGTFTFFRALQDWSYSPDLTPDQVAKCWLNYIIEPKTILWWGGLGVSTEHTAFLRLKNGIPAPQSGSAALNGKLVAEQIGAQIFIDAWGLACPGNPTLAARLAKASASVSHDGEAVYGAVVVATIIAEAFKNPDLNHLLDTALTFIPQDSTIAQLIADIRQWRTQDNDWRKTRERIEEKYGYDKFGGGCHMVPNHALIILALLYAPDSFSDALRIVNTCGWDTDCNSANVGCIQAVRLGLDAIQKDHDWRGPVADRLFLPTADPARCLSDAVRETDAIVESAARLAGTKTTPCKNGARWHFSYPGSVQGWMPTLNALGSPTCFVTNAPSPFASKEHCLAISLNTLSAEQSVGANVATWFNAEELQMPGYSLIGSPILFPGQTIVADLLRQGPTPKDLCARLALVYYGEEDAPVTLNAEWVPLHPNARTPLRWKIPNTHGNPIYQLRLEFAGGDEGAAFTTVFVDSVRILDTPTSPLMTTTAGKPGNNWRAAWTDNFFTVYKNRDAKIPTSHGLTLVQNEGWGQASIGAADWKNYRFSSCIKANLAGAFGIAVAYRGLSRFISLTLHADNTARLQQHELTGVTELARTEFPFELYREFAFEIDWQNSTATARIDGRDIFSSVRITNPPAGGGVALLVQEGRALFNNTSITAL